MKFKKSLISLVAASVVVLTGCGSSDTKTEDSFIARSTSIAYPVSDKEKRSIQVAKNIQLDQTTHQLEYKTILRTGQELSGETFGLLKDENDQPLVEEDGSLYICNGQYGGSGPDHTQFIEKDGK
ncbi:MAG TPA: hypothetical protein EYH11_02330, partial [Sulfurimonas autotrophica]|nr:hypothetical protein [Sulfurimonas autotrophica]